MQPITDLYNTDLSQIDLPAMQTGPMPHQAQGVRAMLVHSIDYPGRMLFWQQGTGKTWAALAYLAGMWTTHGYRAALILCPAHAVLNWLYEAQKHLGLNLVPVLGTREKRVRALQSGRPCVMSYDSLIHTPEWAHQDWGYVICDESHYTKNGMAKRTKELINKAPRSAQRVLLTGTPLANNEMDIWAQAMVCDMGRTFGTSFYKFRARFFYNSGGNFPDWRLKPGAREQIAEQLKRIAIVLRKEDCLDLPPKIYERAYCEMDAEQARAYRQLKREMRLMVGDGERVSVNQATAMLEKLSQIVAGFVYADDGSVHRVGDGRLKLLRELCENHHKTVVWARHRESVARIAEYLQDFGVCRASDRDEAGHLVFQVNPNIRVAIGQIHADSTALTLTAAQHVVYFEQSFSLVDRLQSEDRTHRIGTTGAVLYEDIVCPGTVDERFLKNIEKKRTMLTEVLDGVAGVEAEKQDAIEVLLAELAE